MWQKGLLIEKARGGTGKNPGRAFGTVLAKGSALKSDPAVVAKIFDQLID
ncbi:hypothetical protein [Rhodanobacter sp. BL-MT-08]